MGEWPDRENRRFRLTLLIAQADVFDAEVEQFIIVFSPYEDIVSIRLQHITFAEVDIFKRYYNYEDIPC